MLKSPIRKVGGYGYFSGYLDRTVSSAWDTYGTQNGVHSKDALAQRIKQYARKNSKYFDQTDNPKIGCIELDNVVLLDDDNFVDLEECGHSFSRHIVKIKYFTESDNIHPKIESAYSTPSFVPITGLPGFTKVNQKDRLGQASFRELILKNYDYRCCISGERLPELLEAAHIQPYINEDSNHPQNGLCLRVDLHRLFDQRLISVSEDYSVKIGPELEGSSYAQFDKQKLFLPKDIWNWPSATALKLITMNSLSDDSNRTIDAGRIFAALAGNWTIVRDLGEAGQFTGDVTFHAADPTQPNVLRYREEGFLTRPDGKRFDGYREYDFVLHEDPAAIELLFRDPLSFGNRYVLLQFGEEGQEGICARDIHPCGDDFYHHCMIWNGPDHFETKIKITGPKKDHLLHSIYRRA
ncbi:MULTISPECIES: DUF6314 family protein [Thalassospira]|uniref:HNH nuclease domain-containing protein n=1 Tax=Thalassospira tepidiphila TaxID=393657 RepID=A0ABX0WVC7_9PROT|nr:MULTISPECIES: DUF6314 family protein [Thalassospira]MBO6578230.1 HNH endonuclease [Thalassospira sp.]MBO6802736.1 HNH endonuclease [Thalassospira sp.]MBO6817918.1 HNH endonuclease [Thalassospira sp.]MBO6886757.1 HNH endonuclease [Thalassospira sp.]NJB73240.1 hypothetical protein [Thalassospira tepidiphila]